MAPQWTAKAGLYFVLLFGAVNLFADLSYEGARSVSGPFLAGLGASALVAGLVGGSGELFGYTLRLASGYWADKSRRYWAITILGYLLQMTVIPLLALAGSWQVAAALMILERMGKATRNPPRDVMLSEAGAHMGRGWAFGVNEALDQIGAFLGPLAVAGIFALRADYRPAFAWLALPAVAVLLLVLAARWKFPQAAHIPRGAHGQAKGRHPPAFWWYAGASALVAFGFSDYALIAFHFVKSGAVSQVAIPIAYAFSMLAGGAGSLIAGKLYDRFGLIILVPLTAAIAGFAPLVYLASGNLAIAGVLLWGLGLGVHESVMPAAVAAMIPAHRRASAYGLFTTIFGIAWFLGSALQGWLYGISILALMTVAVAAQLLAIIPLAYAAGTVKA